MDIMSKSLSDPHFFVFSDGVFDFSDSPKITNLSLKNERKNYEDLYLMSQCKHHIIANSSFSWWAAWLGETKGQIVLAPDKWYNVNYHDTSTLIPVRWFRI